MLSYDEALERILKATGAPLCAESVPLVEALGRAAACDIIAPLDLPPFDNSAVDGWAVRSGDGPECVLGGEVPAGCADPPPLPAGAAFAIYTGAPIPEGADAIVMLEDSERIGEGRVRFTQTPRAGQHIRRRGSDIAAEEMALPAGSAIGAGEIALLAALNIGFVECPRRPRVGLLSTGDELIAVGGDPLAPGQIRNSNAPALTAAIHEAGGELFAAHHARDSERAVSEALDALAGCDVIVSSGGVSVGAHDHVKAVLEKRGQLDFWRIALKPGKPLAFGRLGGALFFGLPGNPVSSLVTFELFVRPALRRLQGLASVHRPQVWATLTEPLAHHAGRREFVRARLEWHGDVARATPTGGQGSHRTHSLVGADALLIAHESHGDYPAGAVLPALLLY